MKRTHDAQIETHSLPRWPLFVIALPAAVAVWSGWVGLGGMTGFGVIHPLPGIVSGFTINTAVTLPVGVEAYGAYALGAWLTPGTPDGARRFARASAVGALLLGMLGQVAYHVLAARHISRAPWPVVALVACLPVATLGMGTALTHLMRSGSDAPLALARSAESAPEANAPTVSEANAPNVSEPDAASVSVVNTPPMSETNAPPVSLGSPVPFPRASRTGTPKTSDGRTPRTHYRDALAAGHLPSVRAIQRDFRVGAPKARLILAELETHSRPALAVA